MMHVARRRSGTLAASLALAALLTFAGAAGVGSQSPAAARPAPAAPAPTPAAVICAPLVTHEEPASELRLIASQDPATRLLYGPGDTLVVNRGSAAGIRAGQQYFVRRLQKRFGARGPDRDHPVIVHTAGWIRILAVDERLSTAAVVHACDGMLPGDYLEPFAAPPVRAPSVGGEVRYDSLAQIIGADEQRSIAGEHELMVIDRGSDHGVASGDRFLVLRDKRTGGPLVEIGEGIVVTVRAQTSAVQIVKSRDAVMTGDLVALRK